MRNRLPFWWFNLNRRKSSIRWKCGFNDVESHVYSRHTKFKSNMEICFMLLSWALNFLLFMRGCCAEDNAVLGIEDEGGMFITPRNKWVMINGLRVSRVYFIFIFIFFNFRPHPVNRFDLFITSMAPLHPQNDLSNIDTRIVEECVCELPWRLDISVLTGNLFKPKRANYILLLPRRQQNSPYKLRFENQAKTEGKYFLAWVWLNKTRMRVKIKGGGNYIKMHHARRVKIRIIKSILLCNIILFELDINYIDQWINIEEA